MLINGCQEGKATPKLVEILCPDCGETIEVFVQMGGAIGKTGTLVASETCPGCGREIRAGSCLSDYQEA